MLLKESEDSYLLIKLYLTQCLLNIYNEFSIVTKYIYLFLHSN